MVPDVMSQKETLNRPAIRRELLDCLWCPPTRRCCFLDRGRRQDSIERELEDGKAASAAR